MMGPLGTGFAETGFGCSLLEGLFEGEDERGENANESGGTQTSYCE